MSADRSVGTELARPDLAGAGLARTDIARRELARRAPEIPVSARLRVIVEHIRPSIDAGRFPIKRSVGETVEVHADIFADGHDALAAVLRDRRVAENAEAAEIAEEPVC